MLSPLPFNPISHPPGKIGLTHPTRIPYIATPLSINGFNISRKKSQQTKNNAEKNNFCVQQRLNKIVRKTSHWRSLLHQITKVYFT